VVGAKYRNDDGSFTPYDAEKVRKSTERIGYAISARRQRYPEEAAFVYRPHEDAGERYDWNDAAREAIKDYNGTDLRI
jgi:hypothetical protein